MSTKPTTQQIRTTHPNPALQVTADHNLKNVDAPVYEPGYGEVLVHVTATGVCGSDIHFWKRGRIGDCIFHGDCTIGHETAGVVLKCGEGVENLQPGDRVAVEPGVPCETCYLCREGKYNLCDNVKFSGVYPHPGSIQRYKLHPAKWLHKVPQSLSTPQIVLLEPLSVILHSLTLCKISLGTGVLICGAGPIGLVALAAAKASGAHPIVVTDIEERRLDFARNFVKGVKTFLVDVKASPEETAEKIRGVFLDAHGFGHAAAVGSTGAVNGDAQAEERTMSKDEIAALAPMTVLECTGVESSIITSCFAVRRAGTIVVVGVGREVLKELPFMHLNTFEVRLEFSNRYCNTWPAAISCLAGGVVDLRPLVTHTFSLEKAEEAVRFSADVENGNIKVLIVDEEKEVGILEA